MSNNAIGDKRTALELFDERPDFDRARECLRATDAPGQSQTVANIGPHLRQIYGTGHQIHKLDGVKDGVA